MKDLFVRVLIGALLITSQASLAGSNCVRPLNELMSAGQAYKLRPGETVWGNYVCRSCGNEASMKPDRRGDVRCETCASPHTNEPDYPPAFFKKGGQIFIINREALMGPDDARYQGHGLRDNCPFCETGHFANMRGCNSCGAELVNADAITQGIPQMTPSPLRPQLNNTTSSVAIEARQVETTRISGEDLVQQAGLTEEVAEAHPIPRFGREAADIAAQEEEEIIQRIPLTREQMMYIGAGGTIIGATAGVAIYKRAHEEYTVTATVTRIESGTVYASYSIDGQRFTIDLSYDQGNTVQWRIGEQIELYIVHWKGPQGAERGNGEVYPVNQD